MAPLAQELHQVRRRLTDSRTTGGDVGLGWANDLQQSGKEPQADEAQFQRPRCALQFAATSRAFVTSCGQWLQQAGLEVEVLSGEEAQMFIVVSASRQQLEEEAEKLGFLKEHTSQQPYVLGQGLGKVEFTTGDHGLANYDRPDFWLPCETARLLQSLLERIKLPEDFPKIIAETAMTTHWRLELARRCSPRLLSSLRILGLLDDLAPMHTAPMQSKVWQALPAWWPSTPEKDINDYFGSKVAMYFAWMNSFTAWLVPLAIVGVAAYARMRWYDHSHDDDPYLPFYSLVVVLWATAFLRTWEGRCTGLAWQWGVYGVLRREEVRAEFRGGMRISPVTGQMERHFAPWKRGCAYLASVVTTLAMLGVAFFIMVCSLNLQGYMSEEATNFERLFHFPALAKLAKKGAIFDPEQERYFGALTYVPVLLHVLTIRKLNDIYSRVAQALTQLENHKLVRDYEDAMIAKRFLFDAFDCYIAPFYVAFVMQDVRKLRSELIQVYVVDSLRRVFLETLLPLAHKLWARRKKRSAYGAAKKSDDADAAHALVQLQDPVYDEFDDFLEMVLEFGYITLFASAFPLAGVLSIICNIIEMKSDLFKLVWVYQRPLAFRTGDLGTWGFVLKSIVVLSVLSNAMLFAMSEQLAQWFPHLYRVAQEVDVQRGMVAHITDADGDADLVVRRGFGRYVVLIAVAVEHLVAVGILIAWNVIPSRPEWVSDEIARMEKHKEKNLRRLQKSISLAKDGALDAALATLSKEGSPKA
mmetsp:Transcript_22090/g.50505  ORF Transcript_22090/g.50505 Transcript_22090/m.50505 type:complete len:755 (-) Transcript_22090:46-2310(-)